MMKKKFLSVANDVINLEIKALQSLKKSINNLSQIYMCGPGRLTASLLDCLEKRNILHDKYTII